MFPVLVGLDHRQSTLGPVLIGLQIGWRTRRLTTTSSNHEPRLSVFGHDVIADLLMRG